MQKYRFTPDSTGFLSEEDTRKYFSRIGFAVFALGMVSFAVQILLILAWNASVELLANAFPWMKYDYYRALMPTVVSHLISMISTYAIALPVFLRITKGLPKARPFAEKMKFGGFAGGLCICFFLMMAGNYVSQMFVTFFSQFKGSTLENPVSTMMDSIPLWVNLLFVGILGPIFEEILFRKLLCDRLLPLGEGYAVVLSAAIFSLIHGNFFQIFYAFLVGLIFGFVYVKTGKLRYSITYHMTLNIVSGVIVSWIMEQIDWAAFEALLELEVITPEALAPHMSSLMLLLAYELVVFGLSIAGAILCVSAIKKKKFSLDAGILPPPKKGRLANIFCNMGVAAAVAYFVFSIVLSFL